MLGQGFCGMCFMLGQFFCAGSGFYVLDQVFCG